GILGLDDLLGRKPKQLSGGQRQRVAMGRAIVREPSVFLMDEPLSNLDAKLRVDTPRNLYEKPANVFVAGFIGSPAMNLRGAKLVPEGALLSGVVLPLSTDSAGAAHAARLDEVTIGIRPESASLSSAETPGALPLTVALVEELGADAYVYGELEGDGADD